QDCNAGGGYLGANEVYLQKPDHTWVLSNTYSVPFLFYSVDCTGHEDWSAFVLKDINGDGLNDFAQGGVDNVGTRTQGVYINNGSNWVSNLAWNVPVAMENSQHNRFGVATADFNGDGLPDLYDNNPSPWDTTGVWLN